MFSGDTLLTLMENSAFLKAVDRFVDEASSSSMESLIAQARSESITDNDIAYLAKSCSNADGLIWDRMKGAADIASTGGPTSLTTLLCPLYLRAFGYKVPKLGVPGRPAGGIDVLAQIPGFKFQMTNYEADNALKTSGYVHFLAGKHQAPLDGRLFAFRKKVKALDVPALVIASLLTKKLVVGLLRVGLEVRVAAFGNFGPTWEQARENAKRFCRVAKLVGVSAKCFLTDASIPYQPYIGRGESLAAVAQVLDQMGIPALENHLDLCYAIASRTAEFETERPNREQLKSLFVNNLIAQGTSEQAFTETVTAISEAHHYALTARAEGFLQIDIAALRAALVSRQSALESKTVPFPDPIGVIIKASHGSYLSKGDLLATVRVRSSVWPKVRSELRRIIKTDPNPMTSRYFEEVS